MDRRLVFLVTILCLTLGFSGGCAKSGLGCLGGSCGGGSCGGGACGVSAAAYPSATPSYSPAPINAPSSTYNSYPAPSDAGEDP